MKYPVNAIVKISFETGGDESQTAQTSYWDNVTIPAETGTLLSENFQSGTPPANPLGWTVYEDTQCRVELAPPIGGKMGILYWYGTGTVYCRIYNAGLGGEENSGVKSSQQVTVSATSYQKDIYVAFSDYDNSHRLSFIRRQWGVGWLQKVLLYATEDSNQGATIGVGSAGQIYVFWSSAFADKPISAHWVYMKSIDKGYTWENYVDWILSLIHISEPTRPY